MATKYQNLLLFLLLLAFQEMMMTRIEASICTANSRVFRGACFSNRNCGAICEKEGFINGECKFLKCVCSKDCNIGGGGSGGGGGGSSGGPPEEDPPAEGPPEEGPPAEGPPEEGQPGEGGPPEEGATSGQKKHVVNRKSLLN